MWDIIYLSIWDETAICRGAGSLVLLIVGCLEIASIGHALDIAALAWIGYGLMTAAVVFGVIYINKSKRFKRRK